MRKEILFSGWVTDMYIKVTRSLVLVATVIIIAAAAAIVL